VPGRKPTTATLVCYQVGFGDCFLLSFHYPKDDRHVLIDFGSTGLPPDASPDHLKRIAADIRTRTGGKLTAVVESHRHADHISGYATSAGGKGPGDVIASLKPDLVIQPWTEDPRAKVNATTASADPGKAFVASLGEMHALAASVAPELRRLGPSLAPALNEQLGFLGTKNIANASAVNNLMRMGKKHAYVSYGSRSGLDALLPNVKVHVLGPPTLKQSSAIAKQRSRDAAEFWQLHATTTRMYNTDRRSPLPGAATQTPGNSPAYTRWIRRNVQNIRGATLLEIVRSLDKQMNNTSVILLFEVGRKALLFPGDAQIENWQFALAKPETKALLRGVSLYKVGHHASLNASPKTMWGMLANRSATASPMRLRTVVSTMAGKFGSPTSGTEVPRAKLLAELKKNSDFFSTHELRGGVLNRVFEIALR